MKSYQLFLFLTSFLFYGCSFNKIFLQPDTYPAGLTEYTIKTKADTFIVHFSKDIYQPTFTNHNGKDTAQLTYTIESMVFKDTDGNVLNGWFLKPKEQKATITLLHLHGNGGSLLLTQYRAMSPLLKNGFQIFLFDYSGFGFSTGKPTRKNALINALSAFDHLKARTDVKGTRLVIYGQSFGGHLSAVVAEKRQKEIDGLVIEGAFSSPKDIAAHRVPLVGRLAVKQLYSAKCSIKKFNKPLLVIHSTEDKIIPFRQGQKIFKAANVPKEFYEIKQCHICGPMYYNNEISEKIKAMLN